MVQYCPAAKGCPMNDYKKCGIHFCVRPTCSYPERYKRALGAEIARIRRRNSLSERDLRRLSSLEPLWAEMFWRLQAKKRGRPQ